MASLMDLFNRKSWFGGEPDPNAPTPLFPPGVITDKQSLFGVTSDKPPITPSPSGPSGSGWGAVSSWLNAPAYGDAAGADPQGLMAYKPQSRLEVFGKALSAAGQGVLAQRGPYANPLGGGLVGATQGLEQAREQDTQGRKEAFAAQAKQAQVALERVKALNEARKAESEGGFTLPPGQTRFNAAGEPIATAGPETTVVNGQLIDKATGQPIGAAIPTQPTTFEAAAVNKLAPGGQLPGTAAETYFGAKLKDLTKQTGTNVSLSPQLINQKGEGAYATKMGEQAASEFQKYRDQATTARNTLGANQQLRAILPTIETGGMEAATMPLRQIGAALGIADADKLSGQQLFDTVVKQRVLQASGGKLGAGVSDSDVAFLKEAGPSVAKTKKANTALLDISDKIEQRNLQIADMAANFAEANRDRGGLFGRDPQGRSWDQALKAWAEANPLFGEDEKKALKARAGADGAAADLAGAGYQ